MKLYWRTYMARSTLILVCDEQDLGQKVTSFAQGLGVNVQVYSSYQWNQGMQNPSFMEKLRSETPHLSSGSSPLEEGAKIIQFPVGGQAAHDKRVQTMNELESVAISNAISEFGGNLTEAAKALGIGRATLYRKVKQYNIDPSQARKKRSAA
jgi:DNA-binding NtrC family response regulator